MRGDEGSLQPEVRVAWPVENALAQSHPLHKAAREGGQDWDQLVAPDVLKLSRDLH